MSDVQPAPQTVCQPAEPARTVRVGDVCRLAGDRQLSLPMSERLARKGPYPLYAENCTVVGIDDWSIEAGGTVMVGAFGQVIANTGYLVALYEPGRCSATEHVHALIPHDPADGRYLWRVLTTSPKASRMVTGTSQVRQLSGPSLLSVPIPWPCRSTRDAYVDALDEFDRRAQELAQAAPSLLREGDEAFERIVAASTPERVAAGSVARWQAGTDVPASDRDPGKPVRVEGPTGRLGRCDAALTDGPAVVVGPSGRRLLAHYLDEPSHPIAEMRYVDQGACDVELPVLLFALRHAGVYESLRRENGKLTAPQLDTAALADLLLCVGTPEARAAFVPVAEDLLARALQAQRDADRLAADRRDLTATFIATGTVGGTGSCEGCASAVGDLPESRGVSIAAERAAKRAQEATASREEQARRAGLLPLADDARRGLGPLADLAEKNSFGLAPADVAWELAPLAVLRTCADAALWERAVRAGGADPIDRDGLLDALDAAMADLAERDDLLSFMPNLSYRSSLLAPEQLAVWVRALDAVDPAAIDGPCVRAAFALEPGTTVMPAQVRTLVEGVLRAVAPTLPEGFERAYVPCEACEGMVDALGRVLPDATVRAQFDEFAHMLEAAMVRAVDLRAARETRGGLGAAAGCALTADEFSDWKAELVAAVLPPNAADWCATPVPADDPRWELGVPPRSRANYAWLQHALWHQEKGGATVLLACSSLLHSNAGSEQKLRARLAQSGRLRMVVALPARIFSDGRPAMSLLVLGDRPEPVQTSGIAAPCLMVNALDLGVENPAAPAGEFAPGADPAGVAERILPEEAVGRILRAVEAWFAGERPCEPGFARVVEASDLAAHDAVLAPWAYA